MTLTVNTLTSGSNADDKATTASINPTTASVIVAMALTAGRQGGE